MGRTSGRSRDTSRRLAGSGGRSEPDRYARRRSEARCLLCSLPAELPCNAGGAEEEDLVFGLVVVGIDEVAAPPAGRLIRLVLALRTDQRLPHVRTLVD